MRECTDFSEAKITQNGKITRLKHDYISVQPNMDFHHSPTNIQTKCKL